MAPVSGPRFRYHNELTREGINGIISYWLASQKTRWHDARICLGETRTDAFNRFDLCYSFKVLCQAEYRGTQQLHHAAKNYARNYGLSAGVAVGKTLPSKKPSPLPEHKIFGCRYLIRRGVHRKMVITRMYLRLRCMFLT